VAWIRDQAEKDTLEYQEMDGRSAAKVLIIVWVILSSISRGSFFPLSDHITSKIDCALDHGHTLQYLIMRSGVRKDIQDMLVG
jgi:hypothetical protein